MVKVVHLQKTKTEVAESDKNPGINYIPCKIHYDGEAKVSQYFSPYISKNDKEEHLKASFRGFPLKGIEVALPKGYKGLVLEETLKHSAEDKDRNLYTTHVFNKLTYWNWDKEPTRNDAFISALDWIDIAESIHSPVVES